MNKSERLRQLVSEELSICCQTALPRLQKMISTPEGMERAEDIIYSMCSTEGLSVQQAMAQYDSDLDSEYDG